VTCRQRKGTAASETRDQGWQSSNTHGWSSFDGPILGLSGGDGRLARAEMFYFGTAALVNFLQTQAA
jgi:hypothetical protein